MKAWCSRDDTELGRKRSSASCYRSGWFLRWPLWSQAGVRTLDFSFFSLFTRKRSKILSLYFDSDCRAKWKSFSQNKQTKDPLRRVWVCRKEGRGNAGWWCQCWEKYRGSQFCFCFQSPKWRMLVCFQRAPRDDICGEIILSVKMGENI